MDIGLCEVLFRHEIKTIKQVLSMFVNLDVRNFELS